MSLYAIFGEEPVAFAHGQVASLQLQSILRSREDHRVRLRCRGLSMRHQGRSMRRQVPTSQVLWMILLIVNLLANV